MSARSLTVVLPKLGEVTLEYIGARESLVYYVEPNSQQVFTYLLEVGNFKAQGSLTEVMRALPPHLRPKEQQ